MFKDWAKNLSQKEKIIYSLVVVVLVVGAYLVLVDNKPKVEVKEDVVATTTTTVTPKNTAPKTVTTAPKGPSKNVMNRCNFRVTSPEMYSAVNMPFTVSGILDKADTSKGCMWNENATRAGEAEIFYNRRNEGWKSAGTAVPIITKSVPGAASTTMSFSVSFNLYTTALGLTSGTPIKIVFTELNIPVQTNPDIFDFQVTLR